VARGAALLALGALAVHQLRYLIAFGSQSGEALHREGHSYLAQALPILVALAVALVVATVVTGALARRSGNSTEPAGVATRALAYAGALFVVFAAQELVEGTLAPGHPAGVAALFAGGAWVATPLALALGLAAAVAERLLVRTEAAIATVLAPRWESRDRRGSPSLLRPRVPGTPRAASPLAFGLARRPPPLAART
jgi:hypothetical protein